MLSPLKRNYYLRLIILFVLAFNNVNACQKIDSAKSIYSVQDDTLVSEFYQFLKSETDLGWQTNFVTINYKDAIDKFTVRILWIPRNEESLGHISGPGIIEFIDPIKFTRFTIKCVDLAFSMERVGINSVEQRQGLLGKSFELQFDKTTIKNGFNGGVTEPFFFYDVDFDNRVEIVVTQFGYGVQNSNTYKAYKLNGSGLENDSEQISDNEPFSQLNDFTEFNKKDRTVTIENFFGGGETQSSIYKKLGNNDFKLISIIKYTFEEKITFELVNDEMIEVKREKVK